MSSLST